MTTHPGPRRRRAHRPVIRQELVEAAVQEFAARGFDGASTRAIAARVGAHQPQINYHFASKEALWRAAADHLFGLLHAELDGVGLDPQTIAALTAAELAERFADAIRRFVRFAARHPELNRIMIHEGYTPTDRLQWLTGQHIRPLHEVVTAAWSRLRSAGIAAPLPAEVIHHVLVGAASLPYAVGAEVELLGLRAVVEPQWVEAHADGLVATLLPGTP
ncbi:TetR/AcrR family transcriptional regulator [Actinomadura sp. 6N118]|uniref:TetR/AcrR family transcriptional regulator n=1 Tax=Actinomadura sp. 6N118 TaxID=3375151 RepID=UPI0037BA30BB